MAADVPVVLCPPWFSPSLRYRPHSDCFGSQPFLAWWVHRITGVLSGARLFILSHSDAEAVDIDLILKGTVPIIRTTAGTKLAAFGEVAEHFCGPIVFVS